MALARLDMPGPACSTADRSRRDSWHGQRRHHPGRVRGGRRARAPGTMTDAELCDARRRRLPGAGACGGQFTANTMAIVVRVPRHRRARQRQRAGQRSGEGRRSRATAGELVMALVRERPAAARHHHARRRSRTRSRRSRRPAARPTPCCTCWRSRARRASTLDARRLRSHQRARAAARRPEAGGPVRRHRPARGRRQRAGRASGCSTPGAVDGDAPTVTGRTLGAEAAEAPSRRRARRSSARSTSRSSRPAAW